MIQRRPSRRPALLFAIACALPLVACSGDAQSDAEEAVQVEQFADLFSNGFGSDGREAEESAKIEAATLLAYRADPGLRRRIADQLADNLNRNFSLRFRMANPEAFLRSGEAADVGNRMIEALGLPSDTVAGATVLMFGLSWELANQEALQPADQRALLNQASTMLADHDVKDGDDEARQGEGDTRLLVAALWLEEARLRRGDEAAMRELSDAVARDMQRLSGNDMRAHRITGQGFVDR